MGSLARQKRTSADSLAIDQRGRNAIPRHVGQHDRQPLAGQLDVVVVIAADLVGRFVEIEKVIVRQPRRRRRQQPPLHLVGQLQILLK